MVEVCITLTITKGPLQEHESCQITPVLGASRLGLRQHTKLSEQRNIIGVVLNGANEASATYGSYYDVID